MTNIVNKISKFEMTGDEDLDKLLARINNGEDINIQSDDGNTPLTLASSGGNIDICRLLIENGADINIQNKEGDSPLIIASYGSNMDLCKLLLKFKANINMVNNEILR